MKKLMLVAIVLCFTFSGCGTLSTARVTDSQLATFTYEWTGYSFDKLFNATMYALNTSSETVVEADRTAGTIHTRFYNQSGMPEGNGYYLITQGSNAVYYSASILIESVRTLSLSKALDLNITVGSDSEKEWIAKNQILVERDVRDNKSKWSLLQMDFVQRITEAYKKLWSVK